MTVNRPEALNALNTAVLEGLSSALDRAVDDAVCAVIITGDRRAFAAGADISEMQALGPREALALSELGHRVMSRIETLEIPVVAMVHGYALGGGMELAMACDLIYCDTDAKFGQPEVGLGIIPGFGGTQRLARLVGRGAAKELIYSGEIIDARKAKEIGLVRSVHKPEALEAVVLNRVRLMVSRGGLAVGAAKRVMNSGVDLPIDAAIELEKQAFSVLFDTADQKEGMLAFLEKRSPSFKRR